MNRTTGRSALFIASFSVLTWSMVGCDTKPNTPDIAASAHAVVTDCDYLNPALHPPLPNPVDYARELMITDLSVVEDPCRTTWFPAGPCAPGTVGVWTFGALMMHMAGARPPEEFVAEWLHTFEVAHVINGFPVPNHANIRPMFIDPWLVRSGCPAGAPLTGPGACPLDLQQAPFRLLAVVNRVDLAGPGYGSTSPGEARLVFGFIDPRTGAPFEATVIFEYNLPITRNALDWEQEWHVLSTLPLGSIPYRDHLQSITDQITVPGAMPGAPNHDNAIAQVRTNEISFSGVWVLNEYTLQDIGLGPTAFGLLNDTTKQTPDDSMLGTPALDSYLVAHEPDILTVDHVVDPGLLGGATTAPFLWQHSTNAISPTARHLFGFSTCNGCHTVETATNFVHVTPRNAGVPSALSPFMAAPTAPGAGGLPAFFQSVPDPAGSGLTFRYNEPWRRVCEATRILNGDPNPFTKANGAH